MRRVLTRNDNTMCVMQLECWHESAETIELVIFPRTWQQLQTQLGEAERPLSEGDIVLVIGRYETGRGFNSRDTGGQNAAQDAGRNAQIIVETLRRDLEIFLNGDSHLPAVERMLDKPTQTAGARNLQVKLQLVENAQQNEWLLRKVNEILRSYEGADSYSIRLYWGERQQDLRFPQARTRICDDLLRELSQYVGRGDVLLEEAVG